MNKRLLKKKISRLDDEVLIDLYLERRLSKRMSEFVRKEVANRFHIVHSFAEVELDMLQQMLDGEDNPAYELKRNMKWKGIKIKGIPYETTIEGSIEDSYIPYQVEKVLVGFLGDTEKVFPNTELNGEIEYKEIEKLYGMQGLRANV